MSWASRRVRFIRAPEWMTTRSAPIHCGHPAGGGDIADGLLQGLRIRVCQVDEVGGVEGEGDARLPGALSQLSRRLLPHMDPLAALVLVAARPRSAIQPGASAEDLYPWKSSPHCPRGRTGRSQEAPAPPQQAEGGL